MTKDDNRLIVIGAGGHAKVVLSTVAAQGKYEVIGLLSNEESKHGTLWYSHRVLGGDEQLATLRKQGVAAAIVAIGDNQRRAEVSKLVADEGFELATLIHPTAVILDGSVIGEGSVVLPHAFVGADASVGAGAILSIGVVVAHDCKLGAWCQLCPGARLGGEAKIGESVLIGMGATVLPGKKVGARAVIGANAAVIQDVPAGATAVGVPARIVNRMDPAEQPEPERS